MISEESTSADPPDIWVLLELPKPESKVVAPTDTSAAATAPNFWKRARSRASWLLLDLLGLLFWGYVIFKLFVADVDRILIRTFLPSSEWLLTYRVALPIGVAAVGSVFFWRWKTFAGVMYILMFPLVVIFWKLPKLVYTSNLYRSSLFLMATLNVIVNAFGSLRYNVISKGIGCLAAGAILLSERRSVIGVSAATILVLLMLATVRVFAQAFTRSSFISTQKSLVQLVSKVTDSAPNVHEAIKAGTGITFAQAQAAAGNIQMAAVTNRALYLYAYKLQQYRESNFSLMLNAVSYGVLFIGAVVAFFLMNTAVLKLDSAQYAYGAGPSNIAIVLYSLCSLALADGGGLAARGDLAYLLRILAGVYGPTFLMTAGVSTLLALRASRDDSQLRSTVADLRNRARAHEIVFQNSLRVPVDEACRRLAALGFGGMLGVLEWLNRQMPGDFPSKVDPPGADDRS